MTDETKPPTTIMAAPGDPMAAPPAESGEPPAPPFAPVPQTIEDTGGGGSTLWLVLALAAVAVVAVLLVWAFALRDTGEQFAGDWAPADGSGGGLVVSLQGDDFTVTMYDEDLEVLGSYPAARDGDVLTYRFTDAESGRGMTKAMLTLDEDRDVLTLRLTAADAHGSSREYIRVDALQAAAPPTPTVAPTASPSASPTDPPSPGPSPTSTDPAALDQQVVEGVSAINGAVVAWSAANGNVFPAAADVSPDGAVRQYLTDWPANPYTGEPMSFGSEKGDYTYEQLTGGQGYRLTAHLSAGTLTMP